MTVELFIKYIFSKHSISFYITSDWGPKFILSFFRSLVNSLDIKLHFTLDYHLEVNSQTERTNQTLE